MCVPFMVFTLALPLQGLSVSQSSMMTGGSGLNAIDGDDNAVFAEGHCSSTAEGECTLSCGGKVAVGVG